MPLSLPLAPTKEHCTSGAFLCAPRVLDARKEINRKKINISNKHREGKREQLNPKPNIQKSQEAKQQCESLTEFSGCRALGSCWPATPLQIWVVHVSHRG